MTTRTFEAFGHLPNPEDMFNLNDPDDIPYDDDWDVPYTDLDIMEEANIEPAVCDICGAYFAYGRKILAKRKWWA